MNEPRTYTVSEARSNLADVINRVTYTEQPAVITKNGKDAVALIPYRLLELLTRIKSGGWTWRRRRRRWTTTGPMGE